jgi:hypothetical protein
MDTEAQRARVKKWATIGLVGLVGLIVSPIIFLAIQGLVGLVIAGVVGLSIVTFTPWMTMKFANWKVQAIIYEAKENPIETMINLLAAKQIAFKEFQVNVTTAVTARNNFKSKIETFAAKYPARAPEFKTQLVRMTDLVERKKKALNDAEHMLEEGHTKLEEMKAYWDMSQAAQAANKAAGMDTGDQFERLKSDTAVDAVFESMNRAFAELEVAAALDVDSDDKPAQPVAQLTNNKSDVIDVVVNTQKVSVQ